MSDECTLNNRLSDLKMYLLKRKYLLKLIEDAISTVRSLDRRTLLNNNDKIKEANAIPYVTTFNPYNPEIFPDIKQLKSILHRNNEVHEIFKNKVFLKSKRQPPNLKRLLTKAKFTNNIDNECQCQATKCKEPLCGLCKFITEGSSTYFKD